MNKPDVPDTIKSGWPEKEFLFARWEKSSTVTARSAIRNRRPVWYPIYRAADGSEIVGSLYPQYKNPEGAK